MSQTNVTQSLANPRKRRGWGHTLFIKVLMGFASDRHTYKNQ